MGGVLRKLFNLYPGEGRRTLLFLLLGFLWATSCFGLLTLADGMFLMNMGATRLPSAYLITALSMTSLAALLFYAFWRHSSSFLFRIVIGGALFAECTLIVFLLNHYSSPPLWFFFKTIGWMAPIAANIAFWAFIEDHFVTQDPKRTFCLFNSAIFLGDATGGALISFGLPSLGTLGILLIFAAFLSLAFLLFHIISKPEKGLITVLTPQKIEKESSSSYPLSHLSELILRSPFTLFLMLFYFVMQLLATTAEYSYMTTFDNAFAFAQKKENLAIFLGKLAMWISLGNMFFGFFLYSRTVIKLGVNNTILVAPLCFSFIFFFWVGKEAFPLALCAMVAREGLLYTFDDNNFLLLITGVPAKVKNQVRTLVEALLEPVSMLCGASLLFLANTQSKTFSLFLALTCLFIALLLRVYFPKALLRKMLSPAAEKNPEDLLSPLSQKERKKIELTLLSHLRKGEEEIKLSAFETLLKMDHPRIPILLNAIPELSLKGKMRAIELLSESRWAREPGILETLERWNRILPQAEVKNTLHFYINKVGDLRGHDKVARIK